MVPSIRTHFFYSSFPNPKPLVGQAGTTLPATIFAWLTWNGLNQLHFQWSHSDWTTAISTYNCKTFVCTVWKPATGGPVQTTHSSRTVQMFLNAQNHSTLIFCNSTITDLTTFHRFCKVGTFPLSPGNLCLEWTPADTNKLGLSACCMGVRNKSLEREWSSDRCRTTLELSIRTLFFHSWDEPRLSSTEGEEEHFDTRHFSFHLNSTVSPLSKDTRNISTRDTLVLDTLPSGLSVFYRFLLNQCVGVFVMTASHFSDRYSIYYYPWLGSELLLRCGPTGAVRGWSYW